MNRLDAAQSALRESGVLEQLAAFSPTIVSTIWVGLDIPGSDIDIVCCYPNQDEFIHAATAACREHASFKLESHDRYVVARCRIGDFPLEIYASAEAIAEQAAWRHFLVMQRLVRLAAPSFVNAVRELKLSGDKTEPAIAKVLALHGEPFAAVMALESVTDTELLQLLQRAGHLPTE